MTEAHVLLREWRISKGLTQAQCAAMVDVAQPTWNAWENNVRNPHIEFAVKIEDITGGFVPVRAWLKSTGTDG